MGKTIQNEYAPATVTPPGGTLRDLLDEQGMSQAELAERMGRSTKFISNLVNGKAPLSQDVALELERVLGVPARFWNRREQQYRESMARQAERNRLKGFVGWMQRHIPVEDMTKWGWIEDCDEAVDQVDAVLDYFGVTSPDEWNSIWMNPETKAAFRKTLAFASEPGAVAAWLRYGELEAHRRDVAPFDKQAFKDALAEIRALTTQPPQDFEPALLARCQEAGVALVLTPQVEGAKISGATRWLSPDLALIQMSLRYKTNDHFWFTFFHEAGHILLHGKRDVFLEGADEEVAQDKETEADAFAADLLIPRAAYEAFVHAGDFSWGTVCAFAKAQGLDPGIVVGRLQHDEYVPWESGLNKLKQRFRWKEKKDA
ncbi:MAG: helix-turn-helix domain-containing protein [Bacteroidetes bacterium]|jgi:addiction module HigA family antidote|nr:helix-turn-helix domain-containing protein [Bacteroidota bacterium]